jgi:hypothetical protein
MDLKYLDYEGFNRNSGGRVAYLVADDQVIFSGLTLPSESTSTINAAENIVEAICETEGLNWRSVTFYDIRTHRGYHKPAGFCEVNKLNLVPDLSDHSVPFRVSWEVLNCDDFPEEVWELFGPFIG